MAPRERRRILVMRYRFIGDTLLTVPFLRQLRALHPNAQIDVLVAPNSGELLRDCPYVDNLIFFDTTRKHRYENPEMSAPPRSFWSYAQQLRQNRYDTAFVLKRSFSSAALAFLAGIPERIGFNTEGRGFLLTRRVPYDKNRHEADCFLDVLQAARDKHELLPETTPEARRLEAWWSLSDAEVAERRLAPALSIPGEELDFPGEPKHVLLHLTSSNPAKQWPMAYAKKLADWLLLRPHYQVHCLGAASDAPVYETLRESLEERKNARARLHNHCGALSLTESMALLSRMSLVVGVDSGTLHMAAAAGVPVLALFGPMNEKKWGPPGAHILTQDVPCRPCNLDSACPHEFVCMRDLHAESVIETIRRMEAEARLVKSQPENKDTHPHNAELA